MGLCLSSGSLAVNTYFKNKRRKATGFSWTITGLGPIIFPYISNFLLERYGAQGSILVYAAISLNAFVCAVTYQPVLWHSPKPAEKMSGVNGIHPRNGIVSSKDDFECKYCRYQKKEKRSIFSSQYLFNEDDNDKPGYEIIEPGTAMMASANDGWYGSKSSFAGKNVKQREQHESPLFKPNHFNREREELDLYISKTSVYSKSGNNGFHCTCVEERALLQNRSDKDRKEQEVQLAEDECVRSRMTFWQKVVQFFDLDLLKDFTFVNLVTGMSMMTFGELNFTILTPFIMHSYGYSDPQISLAMSLLAGMDIAVRFFAPFVLEKVKLSNQTLFAYGILTISIGRLLVTLIDSYDVLLAVFLLIGFGKGLRTLFSPLILPSYVPLKRLPAASGLYLICTCISYCGIGQILGKCYHHIVHFILLKSLICYRFNN